MSRKSFILAILIVVVLVGSAGASVIALLHYEPGFYRRCAVPEGRQRTQASRECEGKFSNQVLAGIYNQREWAVEFNEEEINSYIAGDLITKHSLDNPFPPDISEPRISMEEDKIKLGFRYKNGALTTVVSAEMRLWLAQETNVLVLEFLSLHAGAVPISSQWLLERIAAAARKRDIDVSYYRYANHPVVVLKFQTNRSNPHYFLQQFKALPGKVRVSGRPSESPPPQPARS